MSTEISYNIVSEYEKIFNMSFHKRCCVTNLLNGITKIFDTKLILHNLNDEDCIKYMTNHLWRRKYADLDIYIADKDGDKFWVRIEAERK